MSATNEKVRVLIVDDSALMRKLLAAVLSVDEGIEVVGEAPDPFEAREKIKALDPDVVTLDVEMPRMNGLDFLRKIMELRPTPVVMISSLTQAGADTTLEALEIGAVDFVAKPADNSAMLQLGGELIPKIKAAAQTRMRRRVPPPHPRAGSTASAGCGSVKRRTISRSSGAMPTSRPAGIISKWRGAARAWFARSMMGRSSPVTGLRSTLCSIRWRASSRRAPSAPFLPAWAATAPTACSRCVGPDASRSVRTRARR